MAAGMLAAYYGRGQDSSALFNDLEISKDETYRTHLNKYNVIAINMQEFLSRAGSVEAMLERIQKYLIEEILSAYPDSDYLDKNDFTLVFKCAYNSDDTPFLVLIDEWDCIFREYRDDLEAQKKYLDFLRLWLKDQTYVGLAYLTGILPIKKYGTHSALNMFDEYSMTDSGEYSRYFGFTEDETRALCAQYNMDFDKTREWYDGYHFTVPLFDPPQELSMYCPKSVVEAMRRKNFDTYWNNTETYEALKSYIEMNYDGLKDDVVTMLAGGKVALNTRTFANDMKTFARKDDLLTLLIHLGYLTYDAGRQSVSIPNKEVSVEFVNSVEIIGWSEVVTAVNESRNLLNALINRDAKAVACGIDRAHDEVSILQYNDENALSYTISLAFYYARDYYTLIRELPSGKGFADIAMIPKKAYPDKPAILVELKWDKSVKGAISQIKNKRYTAALEDYKDNLLLVGISYDKKEKKHECVIE
jgi:hypothetical protein